MLKSKERGGSLLFSRINLINIKKEIVIYLSLFVLLSLAVHNSVWFSHPIEHISGLFSHGMPYHPFLYTFIAYIIIVILRVFVSLIKKLFKSKK